MKPLCAIRNQVGESPIWSVAEQALYWVDIEGCRVHCFDWRGETVRSWPLPERVGSIALRAEGGLLAAMETGLFHLRLDDDGTVVCRLLTSVAFPRAGMRFNDGRTDRLGRFWVSSMVRDMSLVDSAGALHVYDGATATPVVSGLITGNGLGFSPDGRTMYLSDSHPSQQCIWTFDVDSAGLPSRQRLFVDMQALPGRPDGAAVDAEGGYWICANDAGLVHRFTPEGRLDRSLEVPVTKPSMCAFGGPTLEHLFITSITPAKPAPGRDPRLDGAVFVTRPGVIGLAEPLFKPSTRPTHNMGAC